MVIALLTGTGRFYEMNVIVFLQELPSTKTASCILLTVQTFVQLTRREIFAQ